MVVDVNGHMIMPDGTRRIMPDDIDGRVSPQEQAVEMVERAAACKGACYGAEVMCIEPQGAEHDTSWAFVGEGRGGYNQVQEFNYVGVGTGSYEKGENFTGTSWKLKPFWRGLLIVGLAVLACFAGFSVMSKRMKTVMVGSQASTTQSMDFIYDCAKEAPALWNSTKQDWCCKKFSKGCNASPPAAPSTPPAAPASGTAVAPPAAAAPPQPLAPAKPGAVPPAAKPGVGVPPVPYDCAAGFDKWEWGWSEGKKAWCCQRAQKGCPPGGKPVPAAPPAKPAAPEVGTPPAATPPEKPAILPYDCSGDATSSDWTPGKTAWCCKHEQKGCPKGFSPTPSRFDCLAGLANWQAAWSAEKKAWCCQHEQKGCLSTPAPQKK